MCYSACGIILILLDKKLKFKLLVFILLKKKLAEKSLNAYILSEPINIEHWEHCSFYFFVMVIVCFLLI